MRIWTWWDVKYQRPLPLSKQQITMDIEQQNPTEHKKSYQELREQYKALHLRPEVFEEFRGLCIRRCQDIDLNPPKPEDCDQFVVAFVELYGSRLWPGNVEKRNHLVRFGDSDRLVYVDRKAPKPVTAEILYERRQSAAAEAGSSEEDANPPAMLPWPEVSETDRIVWAAEAEETTESEKLEKQRTVRTALLESEVGVAMANFFRTMTRYNASVHKASRKPNLLAAIIRVPNGKKKWA
ncbi:hypothetical protein LTS10_009711 [Elasticomyces elasticus]|nr:hypothetical protein LTS10_009711 [Elasticomyces elasticus]